MIGFFRRLFVPRARQRQTVLDLLNHYGALTGLELVKKSDNVLGRGSVYVLLSEMEDAGEITRTTGPATGGCRTTYQRVYSEDK